METKNEQNNKQNNQQKKQPDTEFQKDVQQGRERMDTEGPNPTQNKQGEQNTLKKKPEKEHRI